MKIKLSDAPGLPLSELLVPKPKTRTSLAPNRSSSSIWLYGLKRGKRLARLSDFGCGQTVGTGKAAADPARSRSTEESTPMGNHGATGGGTSPQMQPTPVPKQIEVIQGRLDVRKSRPPSIQTSSAVTKRSAIPELRVQASSEPKSTTSRTGDPPVKFQMDGELVLRSALDEDSLQELSVIAANGTPVREEFGIGVESADALEVIDLPSGLEQELAPEDKYVQFTYTMDGKSSA